VDAAAAHGKTIPQVLLRWAVQHGCMVVPKSCNSERQLENADVLDWTLSEHAMGALDALSTQTKAAPEQNCMVGWAREHDPDFY
jgi:2,5-diketo-D-gluconate reductase A